MAGDARVAKRYATALFNAAKARNVIGAVEEDLNGVANLASNDEKFRDMLRSPRISRDGKIRLLETLFQGKVHDITLQTLRLAMAKGREGELVSMRDEFVRLRRDHDRVLFALVTSADPLNDTERARIVERVASLTGKTIEPEFQVDPALIGGVRVAYDNFVLDGSVRGRLTRLKDRLRRDVLKQA